MYYIFASQNSSEVQIMGWKWSSICCAAEIALEQRDKRLI
jgi:hypothetical protein